jgi:two-component system osmolarity sensor histidine kinase EnvZ
MLLLNLTQRQIIAAHIFQQTVEVLADLEQQMETLLPAQQDLFLSHWNQPFRLQLRPLNDALVPPVSNRPTQQLELAILKRLEHMLGENSEARIRYIPHYQLWLKISMLDKPYWLVIPLGRYQHYSYSALSYLVAIFIVLAIFAAGLFAWRINLPLRRLSRAVQKLGRGVSPDPLPIQGPYEVQMLAQTFNQMLHNLTLTERDRSTMLAGLSHDLRTPITRLRLCVEMMQDESLREGMIQDLDDMERIIQQFIEYVRSESEEAETAVSLNDIILSVCQRYERNKVQVITHLAQDLPLQKLKPIATARVLSNLLDNAIRYAKPPFTISTDKEKHAIVLSVKDCGPGIPEQLKEEVIKPFFRLDPARGAHGGSGLGLSIVERTTKQHHASFNLYNHPKGGLVVEIRYPLDKPTSQT